MYRIPLPERVEHHLPAAAQAATRPISGRGTASLPTLREYGGPGVPPRATAPNPTRKNFDRERMPSGVSRGKGGILGMYRIVLVSILLASGSVPPALAGANEGGILTVHRDPRSCGSLVLPSSCDSLVSQADSLGVLTRWYVVAAFPGSSAGLRGVAFGLGSYSTTNLVFTDWGPCPHGCSPLEISTSGWPGPNTGTSVVWQSCISGQLTPVYWFETYAYGDDVVQLTANGNLKSFADCGSPASADSCRAYGSLGFGNRTGANPCSLLTK